MASSSFSSSTEWFDLTPAPHVLTDDDWHVVEANEAALQLLDLSAEEANGESIRDYVHTTDLGAVSQLVNGLTEGMPSESLSVRLVTMSDETVPADVAVVSSDSGELLWVFGESPQDDEAHDVAFDRQRLSAVVDHVVDGIITIDERGIIQTFNPAAERIFGYDAEEVIGENVSCLMPPPYREEHDGYLQHYQRTGEKRIIGIGREVTGLRKDGTEFPLDLAVSELRLGNAPFYTGLVRDITERKEARAERERLIQQLEDKNAELERFTYTVSHDLKSPLITIKGFLGMLESDAESGNLERLRSDIERIGAAADKMKQLLDELLELSRIGRVANPSETFSLDDVAEDAISLLSGSIEEHGVTVDVVDDLPVIHGDRIRFREVIQNLVENAIKFMDENEDPRIEIGAYEEAGEDIVFVRDNGVGIDPRYLKKVFGLFEQLDPHQKGSGVGLALVHRIIEVHGGRIWVTSEGRGEGATFHFTVPSTHEEG